MTREDVYKLIDGEREYQQAQLNKGRWKRLSKSPAEYLTDLLSYTNRGIETWVNTGDEVKTMDVIRKVAALCVTAMEKNKTKPR